MGWFDRFKKGQAIKDREAAKTKAAAVAAPKKTEKPVTPASEPAARRESGTTGDAYHVLSHPVLSEKAVHGESVGTYTFVVGKQTNKLKVKEAVKNVYGINPVSVRMINVEGKRVRFGRSLGKRQDWKKAIVTLPKGQTISIHEGV